MDEKWVALVCAPAQTLLLIERLDEKAGVLAWTPMWLRWRKKPRCSKKEKVPVPALPGFLFLPENGLGGAVRLRQGLACPGFTVMNLMGKIVCFSEKELVPLRQISDPAPKGKFSLPAPGTSVRISAGSFQGLVGVVTRNSKRESWVRFEGFPIDVKIPPFLFDTVEA